MSQILVAYAGFHRHDGTMMKLFSLKSIFVWGGGACVIKNKMVEGKFLASFFLFRLLVPSTSGIHNAGIINSE